MKRHCLAVGAALLALAATPGTALAGNGGGPSGLLGGVEQHQGAVTQNQTIPTTGSSPTNSPVNVNVSVSVPGVGSDNGNVNPGSRVVATAGSSLRVTRGLRLRWPAASG